MVSLRVQAKKINLDSSQSAIARNEEYKQLAQEASDERTSMRDMGPSYTQ